MQSQPIAPEPFVAERVVAKDLLPAREELVARLSDDFVE